MAGYVLGSRTRSHTNDVGNDRTGNAHCAAYAGGAARYTSPWDIDKGSAEDAVANAGQSGKHRADDISTHNTTGLVADRRGRGSNKNIDDHDGNAWWCVP